MFDKKYILHNNNITENRTKPKFPLSIKEINNHFNELLVNNYPNPCSMIESNAIDSTQQRFNIGSWTYDRIEDEAFWSDRLHSILGYNKEEVLTFEKIVNLIHPDDRDMWKSNYYRALFEKKSYIIQFRILRRDGEVRHIISYTDLILDENNNVTRLVGILNDNTEQKEADKRMINFAYYDSLTNLPNRRKFEDELNCSIENSINSKNKFAILYIDMDGFKRINDTLGHLMGDKLLKQFSSRIMESITKEHFAARIGGDEFIVLIRNMNEINEALILAKLLITSLEKPFYIDEYELFVTASIGIAICPNDGADAETLLKKADISLYRAKALGKNNYQIYSSSMNKESLKLFQLEKDLRKAIKNNEFTLQFQPKVDLETGIMKSAQALIRWEHPQWGTVSPKELRSLAEENDLIYKISDWVFRTVCEQIKVWENSNIPLVPISLNVSPKRFLRLDWLETIVRIMDETKVDPNLLELEFVENTLIENDDLFLKSLDVLKKLGVRITIDNFGTGYSSLVYLKEFKVDFLKIDCSFIKDLLESDAIITKSIIYLAHGLNMKVVAEGVETKEQLDFLRNLSCDFIQGNYYSKPLPNKDFANLLKNRKIEPNIDRIGIPLKNRRKTCRIGLVSPLDAKMSIVKLNGEKVQLSKTNVSIDNIGPGGLCFSSQNRLRINPDMILGFETEFCGDRIKLFGQIMWQEECAVDLFKYGLKFNSVEAEQNSLLKALNILSSKNRNKSN